MFRFSFLKTIWLQNKTKILKILSFKKEIDRKASTTIFINQSLHFNVRLMCMQQNKPKNIFVEKYQNRKARIVSKFLEDGRTFYVYEGIIIGSDSNFIYLSNVRVIRSDGEEFELRDLALNKTIVSYVTSVM